MKKTKLQKKKEEQLKLAKKKEENAKKAEIALKEKNEKIAKSIKIISPSKDSLYVLKSSSRKIDFKTKGLKQGKLLVSKSENLEGAEEVELGANGVASYSFSQIGIYYWTISVEGIKAPVRKLNLSPVKTKLLAPRDNSKVSYVSKKPKIVFRWKAPKGSSSLKLVFSSNKAFSKISKSIAVDGKSSYTVDGELAAGVYFWRIEAEYEGVPKRVSAARKLNVKKIKESLAPPDLAQPVNNSVQRYSGSPIPLEFQWSSIKNSNVYEIQISKKMDFKDLSTDLTFKTSHYFTLEAGNYFWRIRTYNKKNVPGKWSKIQKFTVKKENNVISLDSPSRNKTFSEETIEFSWDKIDGISEYTVYITSKKGSFAAPTLSKTVRDDEIEIELPESGKYYWYVKAKKGSKTYNSEMRKFEIVYDDF